MIAKTVVLACCATVAGSVGLYYANGSQSSSGEEPSCVSIVERYQWVLVFGDLFPLPRELFLFGKSTDGHYFESRNHPALVGKTTSAANVGTELDYKANWAPRVGEPALRKQSTQRGKLTVEILLETTQNKIHHVHITDGNESIVLLGPIANDWEDLVKHAGQVKSCWAI
jgi:hypothetical protein